MVGKDGNTLLLVEDEYVRSSGNVKYPTQRSRRLFASCGLRTTRALLTRRAQTPTRQLCILGNIACEDAADFSKIVGSSTVTGFSNLFEFSSDRERDRQLAIKHTLNMLDFAVKVGAPLVVLHFGSMDLKDYTSKLKELLERGEKGSPKFLKVVAEANAAREAKKKKSYDHARDTLRELYGEAKARKLKFGIEIREAVEELPIESDFKSLLEEFPAPVVNYWHDVGHAQIKAELGFIDHAKFLAERAGRLAGFHIHDVKFPARDHFPPGGGDIDFAALAPFVKPEHIKVFELSPKVPLDSVARSVAHLKRIWGEE